MKREEMWFDGVLVLRAHVRENNMAANWEKVETEQIFMNSVQFVLGNWPAIRFSVDQCFGGQCSNEKERWLQEVIFNVFMENGMCH